MIGIALLSVAITFSGSVRTPNERPNPLDYEIATGLEIGRHRNVEAWAWYERQNGQHHTGVDLSGYAGNQRLELSGSFRNRQAQDILFGDVALSMKWLKYMRTGISQTWDHGNPATCAYFGVRSPMLDAEIKTTKEGTHSAGLRIRKEFKALKCVSVVPTFKYSVDFQKNEYMQGKIVFKIRNGESDGNE